ncbi:MAG: hypothetical protein KIH01_02470 [Candidatus Freyarchaeota archaeon]|nr:hypothetical protein [Candidatus Jordarchaeia archaeon]
MIRPTFLVPSLLGSSRMVVKVAGGLLAVEGALECFIGKRIRFFVEVLVRDSLEGSH